MLHFTFTAAHIANRVGNIEVFTEIFFSFWCGFFCIWDTVFCIWDTVFGILDSVFDILDSVFGILDSVFGIWYSYCAIKLPETVINHSDLNQKYRPT